MIQLFLGIVLLIFGIYLKFSKEAGFAKSKKFSWMFILIGVFSLIGKLVLIYQKDGF